MLAAQADPATQPCAPARPRCRPRCRTAARTAVCRGGPRRTRRSRNDMVLGEERGRPFRPALLMLAAATGPGAPDGVRQPGRPAARAQDPPSAQRSYRICPPTAHRERRHQPRRRCAGPRRDRRDHARRTRDGSATRARTRPVSTEPSSPPRPPCRSEQVSSSAPPRRAPGRAPTWSGPSNDASAPARERRPHLWGPDTEPSSCSYSGRAPCSSGAGAAGDTDRSDDRPPRSVAPSQSPPTLGSAADKRPYVDLERPLFSGRAG